MTEQTQEINYGWQSDFVAKPAEGAIERDLTHATLVLDMKNTLGETFHWEVGPDADPGKIPSCPSTHPGSGGANAVFVKMHIPCFYKIDTQTEKV